MQWLVIGISGVTCGGKTTLAQKLREYFVNQRNMQLWNTPYSISDVQLISQDDYFLPVDDLRHKWVEQLNSINFELITSLDMKQLISDITWTMKGRYLAGDPMENAVDFSSNIQFRSNYNTAMSHKYASHLTGHNTPTKLQAHKQPHSNHHISHHQQSSHSNQQNLNTNHIMRINSQMSSHMRDNKINILLIEGFLIFNQPELLSLCQIKFHFHLPYEKCFERRRKRTYDPPDVTGYFEMCVWPHYEKNFMEFRDRKDIIFLNGEICKEKIFQFVLQRVVLHFEEHCDVACPPPHKQMGISGCGNGNMNLSNSQISPGTNTMITNLTCPMDQQ